MLLLCLLTYTYFIYYKCLLNTPYNVLIHHRKPCICDNFCVKCKQSSKTEKNSNAKGFLLRTKLTCIQVACKFDDKTIRIKCFKPPHTVKALVLNTF